MKYAFQEKHDAVSHAPCGEPNLRLIAGPGNFTGQSLLFVTDRESDVDLVQGILKGSGLELIHLASLDQVEKTRHSETCLAVFLDHDLLGPDAGAWIKTLQTKNPGVCVMLYGDHAQAGEISQLLQIGAYTFIPRSMVQEKIQESLQGGLENRKAFQEIYQMLDDLRRTNEDLKREQETLRKKNEALSFINRLSREITFDLSWRHLLPRMLHAGLMEVIGAEVFALLYCIGGHWHLALTHCGKKDARAKTEPLKRQIMREFALRTKKCVSPGEVTVQFHPSGFGAPSKKAPSGNRPRMVPLLSAGTPLGMLCMVPNTHEASLMERGELLSTVANILSMSLENAGEVHKLREMAVTDVLTGVFNRKGFMDFMRREVRRAERYGTCLSLIMIDVDKFKSINDRLGHPAGDHVLLELAQCLKAAVRGTDMISRFGGDEFAVLLPETSLEKAAFLQARIMAKVNHHDFRWEGRKVAVTISCGIASTTGLNDRPEERDLIREADARLYAAKGVPMHSVKLAGMPS